MRDVMPPSGTSFIALLRREWLEHRTALVFPPAAVLAIIVFAILMAALFSERVSVDLELDDHEHKAPAQQRLLPREQSQLFMVNNAPQWDDGQFRAMPASYTTSSALPVAQVPPLEFDIDSNDVVDGDSFQQVQLMIAAPFFLLLVLVVTTLSVSVTWDERKDRSILFWKSMPISDTQTVLAKFVFLGWLTTWATVLAVIIAQLVIAIAIDIYSPESLLVHLATDLGFWSGLLQLVAFGLWFGVWLAPFLAWGMLVGAAAPRSPTLIAFVIPLLIFVFEELLFDTSYFGRFLEQQLALDFIPGDLGGSTVTLSALANKGLGLIVAALLLAATVWSRRRFNEV